MDPRPKRHLAAITRLYPQEGAARITPLLATVLAVGGFLFSLYQYVGQQVAAREAAKEEAKRLLEARDRNFMKPLWEKELQPFFRSSKIAATIATATDPATRRVAEQEFWKLYEGPLIIVEGKALSCPMKRFGSCLSGVLQCSAVELRERSRALASVIQETIQEAAELRLSEFSGNKFQYHR